MKPLPTYFRNPELMNPGDSVLTVVDVQEKLLPTIHSRRTTLWNVRRLIDGAAALEVPCLVTEQYPQGLGKTAEALQDSLSVTPERFAKTAFSCCDSDEFRRALASLSPAKVLLCGIESHVCVLQTAMDLISEGFRVLLATDAMGSRHQPDHDIALRRLESEGAVLTTTEACLFEWCVDAKAPAFKTIQSLVKEAPPI